MDQKLIFAKYSEAPPPAKADVREQKLEIDRFSEMLFALKAGRTAASKTFPYDPWNIVDNNGTVLWTVTNLKVTYTVANGSSNCQSDI